MDEEGTEAAAPVVVITGAGGGIGGATAATFGRRGARLVLVDIDETAVSRTADVLVAKAVEVEPWVADVTRAIDAAATVGRAKERFGRIDVLVNVAGGSRPGPTVVEMSEEAWDADIALNLKSVYLMSRFAIPEIEEGGGGAIVNVASGAGLRGMGRNAAYVAAKAGVVGLTKAMAIDHGRNGVRVNCVAPGAVMTPLMTRNRTPEEIEALGKFSLAGHVADPGEVAAVIAFLASDEASYVMGQTISVDGGSPAGM